MGEATRTDAAEIDLPELFLRTSKRIRRNQMARLAPLGLTPAQSRALRIIGQDPDPLRMSALADRLGIVPRSATTVVDALVSAGLVTRAPDPANRRSTLVSPTDAGRRTLTRMSQARRDAASETFAALSSAQRETLRELLAALEPGDPA
ncbi:MarR family transcriptional regulator [Nocardia sp. NEAU-G5]|uniref:MarR family transcriptional regulator n=1 Tax=Nocardia albiluteola TaxID=2842303 RepID=A0ABS6B008_9NOCA|nr:MarR family transcriptional regulator [Nocardia albiluteola]MBU3063635.1 MarR family transcriptional regulator [Nocardia albiluteola]